MGAIQSMNSVSQFPGCKAPGGRDTSTRRNSVLSVIMGEARGEFRPRLRHPAQLSSRIEASLAATIIAISSDCS